MIKNLRLFYLVIVITILVERVNSWCLKTQLADSGQINFIDWSRDGTKFVTASQTGRVVVYDARTLDQLHVYTGLGGAVNVVKFSRNSQLIGIGGAISNMHVMRVSDYTIINNSIATGQGSVFGLDFCSGDAFMVSCGNTNFLKLYTVSGANIAQTDTSNDTQQKPISCQCAPTANEVVYGGNNGRGFFLKWNSGSNNFNPGSGVPKVLNAIVTGSARRGVDYNEITNTANFVGSDNTLEIWDPNAPAATVTTKINIAKDMNNVNIAKDGTYAAIVGASGAAEIWSLVNNSV